MTIFIIAVLSIIAAYLGLSAYIAGVAVRARRLPLMFSPEQPCVEVSFPSRMKDVLLRGWYFTAGPECIIIVNGGEQNRVDPVTDTLGLTRDLVVLGYSVLLFDLSGRGESGGQGSLFPCNDRDVGGAVDFMRRRSHEDIKIMGFSSGAAATLLFASREPVSAIVSDSCFASLSESFERELTKRGYPGILAQVLSPGVFFMSRAVHNMDLADPETVMGKVACPVFFIHGERDSGVPVSDAYRLFHEGRNSSNLLWAVPGAEHTQGYRIIRNEYLARVAGFFSEVSRTNQRQVF